MPKIEGIRIRNFRALKDVSLGKLWNSGNKVSPLSPFTVVIGHNGVGKSSLFDAFGFLADCLRMGVEEACDHHGRGGFERLRSSGQTGPIEIEVYYRQGSSSRPITYEVAIDVDNQGRAYVLRERLRQRRQGQSTGWPFSFLMLESGQGLVWTGESRGHAEKDERGQVDLDSLFRQLRRSKEESKQMERVEMSDRRRLAIATLGTLKQHPRIAAFREFIEGWYLSYFTPDAARSIPTAGPQKRLSVHGDNLGNVVQYLERENREAFERILQRITKKIPGLLSIAHQSTVDNRVVLKFTAEGFKEPFYVQQMSDGTLKVFAYLLLLEDPDPPPFLCIEEPENGLYHKLLAPLAREFRDHANRNRGGAQVFATTHQPYLVDALTPEEVWVLSKGKDGFTVIERASSIRAIKNLVEEGLPLGGLWFSDYLDAQESANAY